MCVLQHKKMSLLIKRLSSNATIPTRATEKSAGVDLYAACDKVIPPFGKDLITTDIAIKLPNDTYGRIAPRSGLAKNHHIDVGAGVIDADYSGNISVVLFNHSNTNFIVNKGDRIAQLICCKIVIPHVCEVQKIDECKRGKNGFGSTGMK